MSAAIRFVFFFFFFQAEDGIRDLTVTGVQTCALPAVDTIAAGDSITWAWNAAGSHSIQSTGTPDIFRNSVVMSEANDTYTVTFRNPGTYTYQCAVHGAAMTGRIVGR